MTIHRSFLCAFWMGLVLIIGLGVYAAEPEHPGIYTGVFLEPWEPLPHFEELVQKKMAISMWFSSWNLGKTDIAINLIKANRKKGHLSHVTWEPFVDLDAIINGTYDGYIRKNAKAIAVLGFPVMIRFAHEMNGNWYPWDGTHNGGEITTGFGDPNIPDGPERYVAAFRHIHNIFESENANNVLWLWVPNEQSVPDFEWNDMLRYYPGDKYVDWIGLDGYNWGNSRSFGTWRSFEDIFKSPYDKLTQAIPDKPMIIGEFASTESGGDKAAWIRQAFKSIKKYPRIQAFVWFSIFKETSWSLDSSEAVLNSFTDSMKDPLFKSGFPGF